MGNSTVAEESQLQQQSSVPGEKQQQQGRQNNAEYWLKHSRSGGAYMPPRRAAMLQRELPEVGTEAYQRLSWEALRKSLNGLINKVNTSNIKEIIVELFGENLIRGRGLLVKAVMKAQAAALPFTAIYAAMIAVLNTKLPMIGELLLTRLIHQFRRSYRRNDKPQCLACTMFLAHLVNQRVAHEIVSLQVLTLLLERPTDDSVEIAVGFMRECGAALSEISPKPANAIFERFRVILHEGLIDKRVQYMIEVLFQLRKDRFEGHTAIQTDLDLVAEEDQITHYVSLDDELDPEDALNIFQYDPEYGEKENRYAEIKAEILGEEASEDEAEAEDETAVLSEPAPVDIKDQTSTDLINLRKTIYLTVMSSVDFEECGHKLLKINIPEGLEIEVCNMIVECCSQERTYLKFFGLLSERFCRLDPVWQENFETCFQEIYRTVHRLETNRIRNISKLFSHLLYSDAVSWASLGCIMLTEEETTSASRIFLKFLLQDLLEAFGLPKLIVRFGDQKMIEGGFFDGLFPTKTVRDMRFAINFYTAVGLGGITEDLRQKLEDALLEQQREEEAADYYLQQQEMHTSRLMPGPPSPIDSFASSVPSRSSSPRSGKRHYRSRSRSRSPTRYPRTRHGRSPSRSPSPMDRRRSPARHHHSPSRRRFPSRSPSPRSHHSRHKDYHSQNYSRSDDRSPRDYDRRSRHRSDDSVIRTPPRRRH